MAKLRVGLVGAGAVADLHLAGYAADERAEIVAVCDADEDAAITRALSADSARYYTSFDAMIADPNVDAVALLTPNYLHASQITKALRARKHVSVERPLGITLEEAEGVTRAAAASDRIVQVCEPCLYYKPFVDARALIDAGEIGQPGAVQIDAVLGSSSRPSWDLSADGRESWRFDEKRSGGSPMLYEVGYQAFCIAMFLIGSIDKISAWAQSTEIKPGRSIGAPMVATWQHFQMPTFGSLHLTYAPERVSASRHFPLSFQVAITGTRGTLRVERDPDSALDSPIVLERSSRKVYYHDGDDAIGLSFERATRNFVSACLGEEEPLLAPAEARQLLVLTLALAEALKRGRPISLKHNQ